MSPETVEHQIDAFLGYARKAGAMGFEGWMESKGFTDAEKRQLRAALKGRQAA